jgi:hypothetical protein
MKSAPSHFKIFLSVIAALSFVMSNAFAENKISLSPSNDPTVEKPKPRPPAPQPAPPKPAPPQPTPPKPTPPQPTPPKPTPPQPTPPKPTPPQPTPPKPIPPKPTPVKPPTPPLKPPAPPKKQEPTTPATPQQKQQQQQKTKQDLDSQTQAAKKVAPQNVKIQPGQNAKVSANGKSLAVKDPAKGSTTVYDAKTGKPLASYNKTTGASPTKPPLGAVTKPGPGGSKITSAPGYQKTVQPNGNSVTINRGTTINETVVNKTTVNVTRSVTINNFNGGHPVFIHPERPMVMSFDRYHGGYVQLFRPNWWGVAAVMTANWLITGNVHAYGVFFGVDGYYYNNYASPWYPGYGFVSWAANPYVCAFGCWNGYYAKWGWGWTPENTFYPGYFVPTYSYRHLGYWLAEYVVERELETERLERLAAWQDAQFYAQEQQYWIDNRLALSQTNEPIAPVIMDELALQTQELVSSIKDGQQLFASQEVEQGHIFTVDTRLDETATINGTTYNCRLHAGDLIKPDPSVDLDVEPTLDGNGNPVIDDYGNPETTTFVTMDVVASKLHSCRVNAQVVVQMDTLQSLFTDEKARVIDGMEQSIELGIQP